MRSSFRSFIPIICCTMLLLSCSEEETTYEIGDNWISSNTKIFYIDTMSVDVNSFKFDSIQVGNSTRVLLGSYDDPEYGKTTAQSYLQLLYNASMIDNEAQFDSIDFILRFDGYLYNDTIPKQTVNIYKVAEDIEPTEDGYYYNSTKFTYSELLGSTEDFIQTGLKDSLRIPLDANFGQELFDQLQQNNINNSDEFLNYFHGIYLQPGTNNSLIFGVSTTSVLRMYYSIPQEIDNEEYSMDFTVNSARSFHNISSEFSKSGFNNETNNPDFVPTLETDDQSYLQSGTGISTKIDIPFVERLNDIGAEGIIVEANLKIPIKQNASLSRNSQTNNDSLGVYVIDQHANVVNTLFDNLGSQVYAKRYEEDGNSEFNEVYYNIPISYYLENLKNDPNWSDYSLALYTLNFNTSVDNFIFLNDMDTDSEKIKLQLIYALQ